MSDEHTSVDGPAGAFEQANMRSWTGVSGVVSAAHRSRDGVMHGHTWEIVAWWPAGEDALVLRDRLDRYLAFFDHTVMGDEVAWGEAFARAIVLGLGCHRVDIRRTLERIYARTEKNA